MRVASLKVLLFALTVQSAIGQSTESATPYKPRGAFLFAASEGPLPVWGRVLEQPEGAENATGPAPVNYAAPIAPAAVAKLGRGVRPELDAPKPKLAAWRYSLVALAAAHAADAATSWNKREMNPLLSSSRGSFGATALTIKCVITAGSVGIQALLLRRHPEMVKLFATINLIEAGGIGTTAIHNSFVQ